MTKTPNVLYAVITTWNTVSEDVSWVKTTFFFVQLVQKRMLNRLAGA